MVKQIVKLTRQPGGPDLDLVSHGRRGPSSALRLNAAQIEQVARTVRRTPEVIVKVSGGARDSGGVKAHIAYIDRHGRQPLVTDDGREVLGKTAAADLVDDWNLELSRGQYRPKPSNGGRDPRPKLVHNLVLSMPGRTPAEAVLAAAREFARESFALQYRYAMVLHTDQAHPHVHLVVKAEHETEPSRRLHIDKATLRLWRERFAECLRAQGVAANATPGALRGRTRIGRKDAIHHRLMDGQARTALGAEGQARPEPRASTFMRQKVEAVARELQQGAWAPEAGKARLLETRRIVTADWLATAEALRAHGESALAQEVEAFVRAMPPARTDKEIIAAGLLAQIRAHRETQRDGDAPSPPSRS